MLRYLKLFPTTARAGIQLARWQSTVSSAEISLPEFKLHKLESGPSPTATVSRDEFLHMFSQLATIREMESEALKRYQKKDIRGFCHLYDGQEACAVGIESVLSRDDPVITAYRAHGWTYTRGVSPKAILSELTGKVDGCARGKGGSMHMYAPNFYGGNGIVGAQVPLGAGIAFELKYNDKKNVCITAYGDGAANQGQLFEAFNMSALWKLPVIFVCENNLYGMGTAAHRASASTEYYTRGDYIPGIFADGMNTLAVREATRWAKEYVMAGNGPLVMQLDTYRYHGHSMSDPGKSYRTTEEVQKFRKEKDPILTMETIAADSNLATDDELKEIKKVAKEEIKEAIAFALDGQVLPIDELYNDVVTNTPDHPVRGCDAFTYGTCFMSSSS